MTQRLRSTLAVYLMGNHGRCKGALLGTVRESLKVELADNAALSSMTSNVKVMHTFAPS